MTQTVHEDAEAIRQRPEGAFLLLRSLQAEIAGGCLGPAEILGTAVGLCVVLPFAALWGYWGAILHVVAFSGYLMSPGIPPLS